MPNWCYNNIAFYQEDGGNDILNAFYADIQKYQNYKDPETGNYSDWVGHYLQANRIDTETLYCRGFFNDCELYDNHVRVDMETAWSPLPEVWDLMAAKYDLSYVYISEECGMSIYINTDTEGRFFTTRYMINSFDVDYLELDSETMSKYGALLRDIGSDSAYYDSLEEVVDDFKGFGFDATDLESLNKRLEMY
jgi:hypothetical protein